MSSESKRRANARYRRSPRGSKVSRLAGRNYHRACKLKALSHYGKDGKALCCWPSCKVSDPDMLTLDHVRDDGARHRKGGQPSGKAIYPLLKRQGWPPGFQVLCANHQLKKEILRRRRLQST